MYKKRELLKIVCKPVLFLVIVLLLGNRLLNIFNYKDMGGGGGWHRFYQENSGKIDVVFLGSSHAHCTIDHGYLWDNYGMAGFTLSAGSQKIDSTKYCVEEVLRVQKPEVLVVEVLGAVGGSLSNSDTDVYRNSLGMKWSDNLYKFVDYFTENMNKSKNWKREIFFKVPIIHSRYRELSKSDFQDPIPFMRGYRGSFNIESFDKPIAEDNWERMDLDPERKMMLEEIIRAAQNADVDLVFFASPYVVSDDEQMQFNEVAVLAEENHIPFINFNHMYQELGLDFASDFRDSSHVNNSGAVKVTRYLADFLKSNYEIPDRRGQEGYLLWDQNSRYLKNKEILYNLEQAKEINSYLDEVSQIRGDYVIIVALTGNYTALGEVYTEGLKKIGISKEDYYTGGLWIFRDGQVETRLPGKEYSLCIPEVNGEIHLESIVQEDEDGYLYDQVSLIVNGTDYQMVDNGVNIIIYDENIDQVIDAAGDDVYLGLEMIHNIKQEE